MKNAKVVIASFNSAVGFVSILWIVFFIDLILPINFRNLGIHPRQFSGLLGIFFSPFLHSGLNHLIANSLALLPLLFIAFLYDWNRSVGAIFVIILAGGLGVWVFGFPGSVHVGASGLVFGLIGYLLFVGFYFRDFKAIAVSIIVLIAYGGVLLSLLVVIPGISWSGHFFGFLSGVLAARMAKKNSRQAR